MFALNEGRRKIKENSHRVEERGPLLPSTRAEEAYGGQTLEEMSEKHCAHLQGGLNAL